MSRIYRTIVLLVVMLAVPVLASSKDDGAGHDEQDAAANGDDKNDSAIVDLDREQRAAIGIVVSTLQRRAIKAQIEAPGEVVFNAYRSRRITPRISAQVVDRQARLGQKVVLGQALVTLSSVAMAEAQGQLLVADREWRRSKQLGREVVSDRRFVEAQVARQQAMGRVVAFGMTQEQANELLKTGDPTRAVGRFDLLATQDGTITGDDFIVGEFIEPGRVLFEIADESSLWVEARLTPEDVLEIGLGAAATIRTGELLAHGSVSQIHHTLDESTRTLAVRIEVENPDDRLHPGLFVDTRIEGQKTTDALVVPEAAVLRSGDGDTVVFVEETEGRYRAIEVSVIEVVGGQAVVEGVEPGIRVVTAGAYFVQSELAKSGFDAHGH